MSKDKVMPKDKWEFDEEVSTSFEDMLQRSIPQYSVMRQTVYNLSSIFIKNNQSIIDIGCSRGDAIASLVEENKKECIQFYGIECSEPMIKIATERFKNYDNVIILDNDLRNGLPVTIRNPSLVLSILTIQFTPIEYRQWIIQDIYNKLAPGGAMIFVEKVLGANSYIDRLMINTYLDMKRNNGYTEQQIERKRLSLEGVLVPVTAKWNEELLKMAGFKHIDCFWRWMNFAGWIAIK